jgi:putative ABC transport system permease protein
LVNKLVLENLKHRPLRTLLTVLAIGLQVTLVLTVVGLTRGMIEASATRTRGVGADILVRPPGSSVLGLSSAPMSEKMIAFLDKQPHVAMAQGVVVHGIGGLDSMTGIDIDAFNKMSGGLDFVAGGPFETKDDILVDTNYASQKGLHAGDKTTLANHEWTVRGIVGSGKLAKVFVQKDVLQELTANEGKISMVYVKVDDPKNIQTVINDLKSKLEGYPIFSLDEFLSYIQPENIPGLAPFIATLVGLSVVFGFLVTFLAMYTAVLERTRDIGILKALGATSAFVLGLLVRETVLLAAIGSVIGIVFAFVARWLITTLVPASLPVIIVTEWWWRAALIAVVGAVLGAVYPGAKAAKQDTIEALAYE